jgi:hypothetical protein
MRFRGQHGLGTFTAITTPDAVHFKRGTNARSFVC